MSKVLALLSGKGGSGKTTLALSIASMLSKCCLKVLLIDCDLSTNGATYFYEGKLDEKSIDVGSFHEVFIEDKDEADKLIKINEYMDFMPSIVRITKNNMAVYSYREEDVWRVKTINSVLRRKYDVIIYDCQAGYTDVLKLLLPLVDINLVVMEADAISSAAIRSLYLKIGDLLNDKKIYQIFNKATDEEYEIYSKISGGTVFTNIETVVFDWKIRKAFSMAQIPDMERTSARYGEQVYNICKILFHEEKIQEKIKKYDIIIKFNKTKEEEKLLKEEIKNQNNARNRNKNRIIKTLYNLIVPTFICIILIVFSKMAKDPLIIDNSEVILIVTFCTLLVSMGISVIFLNDITKERREREREIILNSQKLDEILSEQSLLEKQLKKFERIEEVENLLEN